MQLPVALAYWTNRGFLNMSKRGKIEDVSVVVTIQQQEQHQQQNRQRCDCDSIRLLLGCRDTELHLPECCAGSLLVLIASLEPW
jgi:hypothetical protein